LEKSGLYEALLQIEESDYIMYPHNAASEYKKIMGAARELGDGDLESSCRYESEVLSLVECCPIIRRDYDTRFVSSNEATYSTCPDIRKFNDSQIEYYKERLKSSNNVFLKARYADCLYELASNKTKPSKYELGWILVQLLMDVAKIHLAEGRNNYIRYYEDMARAVEVSLRLNLMDLLKSLAEELLRVAPLLDGENVRWVLESSEILRAIFSSKTSKVTDAQVGECLSALESGRSYYWDVAKNHSLHRECCTELFEWAKLLKQDESIARKLLLEIGASYEEEAEHQQGRKQKADLVRVHYLEMALHHYINIGETSRFAELKRRIRECYKRAEQNEFGAVSAAFPQEQLEEMIKPYLDMNKEELLNFLAVSPDLLPDIGVIRRQAELPEARFPLLESVGKSIISAGKKVFQTVDDVDSLKANIDLMYMISAQMRWFALERIFDFLIKERGLVAQDLIESIYNFPLIDTKNAILIEVGINRCFEDDYVSSLHILVPQVEASVRGIFQNAGLATTVIRHGMVQFEETFNEFLRRPEVIRALGERFHKYLQMIFVEQTGLNLRNEIAHGIVGPEKCNRVLAYVVLHCLLLLTSIILTDEESSSGETKPMP